ncbi:DUF5825 family protein [Tenggerimyces flavus]|uniref:DUF5825 family protein n=1 Tax=Tenggerimyces flavus TaxID=1708749 RepID=A0ABV7YKX1_9ACTN|nr:DUF5825 family protein [Tenggerimyces flavus]MBM7790008.1 hypothetical protein [Tenggerimyces flavus]
MIVLGQEPAATVRYLATLRDGLSAGKLPVWEGGLSPVLDLDLVCHLPPPTNHPEWTARFRPGLCYYRHGPGFVEVKDTRTPATAARFVIDDPDLLSCFLRCLNPTPIAGLGPADTEAVEALVDERLVLRFDDTLLTLPHRMTRWPIPAMAS